jgi:hypothetical protein
VQTLAAEVTKLFEDLLELNIRMGRVKVRSVAQSTVVPVFHTSGLAFLCQNLMGLLSVLGIWPFLPSTRLAEMQES